MKQWQCPCGAWVDMTYGFHTHVHKERLPTVEDMVAARIAGNDAFALEAVSQNTREPWKPEYPRRDRPDDQNAH